MQRGPTTWRRPGLLFNWRRRCWKQASGPGWRRCRRHERCVRELERRVRELERLLGRNTVEVDILKEALDVARAENRAERLEVPIDSRAILNRMREISFN